MIEDDWMSNWLEERQGGESSLTTLHSSSGSSIKDLPDPRFFDLIVHAHRVFVLACNCLYPHSDS